MRPQEWSSLGTLSVTDCAQCIPMNSIDEGLDYDSRVMLTCKLLLPVAKAIVHVSPDMCAGCISSGRTKGLPCFFTFCRSAIPTSCYIFMFFYSLFVII